MSLEMERKEEGVRSAAAAAPVRSEEARFTEFRRKVRSAEVLSGAMERLVRELRFSGRLSVVIKNGRVMKSGYEEGYAVVSE